MNEIFSGGFGSRVVQDVRTKLGLAYDVGGSFGASYDHPGIFYVIAGTKSASTVAATQALLDEIGTLKTEPPTPAELSKAKDQVLNSFIFHYDSPEKTLNEQVTLAFYGYPARLPRQVQERHRKGHRRRRHPRSQQIHRSLQARHRRRRQPGRDHAQARHPRQGNEPRHRHPATARKTSKVKNMKGQTYYVCPFGLKMESIA